MRPLTAFAIAIVLSTIFNGRFTCGLKILELCWETLVPKLTYFIMFYNMILKISTNLFMKVWTKTPSGNTGYVKYIVLKGNIQEICLKKLFYKIGILSEEALLGQTLTWWKIVSWNSCYLRSHRSFWSRNSSLFLMSFIPANIRHQCKNYIKT